MNEGAEVVNAAIDAVLRFDLFLFHIINGWCGNPILDGVAWFAQGDGFLKGGMMMAAYWWFWFIPGANEDRRRKIISALIGMIFSLVLARVLAAILPFRTRPLYTIGIDYVSPSIPGTHNLNMEAWSSFPSDNAAVSFALAYGLLRLSPVVGFAALLFTAIWVGLVRIYLGIHYPLDVLCGGLIGIFCAYISGRIDNKKLYTKILGFERNFPHLFYAAMFLITLEISVTFDDIRRGMRGLLAMLHALHFYSVDLEGALAVAVGLVVIFSLVILLSIWLLRQRRN